MAVHGGGRAARHGRVRLGLRPDSGLGTAPARHPPTAFLADTAVDSRPRPGDGERPASVGTGPQRGRIHVGIVHAGRKLTVEAGTAATRIARPPPPIRSI